MEMSIGAKIKSIRELKNYTQEYTAYRLGITQAGYSKIEKGKTGLSLEKLQQLAVIFDLSVENIINFEIQKYFSEERHIKKNGALNGQNNFHLIAKLYEDKILLLEKLLGKTDLELKYYKEKCSSL
ncbi:helix-turn-helix domain-containing protein [Flavobacterium ginsenosidimutans]|uniref:helix-turn-helix domain-containing protein n=1 Tax=Flavobacterium ginsenosidimutans TaxID=687844 RepID=UPI000DAED32A|nr:helix-turn-helix domain-containing protein [Flavobacterium ginsenosidimutans]KAF2328123.1 helix-turn-helix transcriptional regulator [Flavobacterium ginsenosidimutans]